MQKLLIWLYLFNAIFLINHEIDSAYWNEWKLFKIRGGITTFLLLHFPLLFFVLYGIISINNQTCTGLWFLIILSISGIFAFTIHMFFIKKGYKEFRNAISLFILYSIFFISLFQFIITLVLLINWK
ncbi:DUF6713 family protein [Calditrichota bacterium]